MFKPLRLILALPIILVAMAIRLVPALFVLPVALALAIIAALVAVLGKLFSRNPIP